MVSSLGRRSLRLSRFTTPYEPLDRTHQPRFLQFYNLTVKIGDCIFLGNLFRTSGTMSFWILWAVLLLPFQTFVAPANKSLDAGSADLATTIPYPSDADFSFHRPAIEALFRQTERLNFIRQSLNPTATTGSNCSSCERPRSPIVTETCDSNNNYLQEKLESFVTKSFPSSLMSLHTENIATIRPKCFQLAMSAGAFGERGPYFGQCNSATGSPSPENNRPCVSATYIRLGANSFNALARCLRGYLEPDAGKQEAAIVSIFKSLAKESGFHINARSYRGAGGVGQITDNAIADVNNGELSRLRNHLRQSSSPTCKGFDAFLNDYPQPLIKSDGDTCGRSAIENGNPISNLMYAFAYNKILRNQVKGALQSNSYLQSVVRALPQGQQSAALETLTLHAYNAGYAGTMAGVSVLNSNSTTVRNIDQFRTALGDAIAQGLRNQNVRDEKRNYAKRIGSLWTSINSSLREGEQCTYPK